MVGSDGRGFLVARFTARGTLDRSFGRRGRLTIRFAGRRAGGARAVALFRDGRILVAGTFTIGGVRRFAVARLQPGGNLDENFGAGGVAVVGPAGAQLEAMALQPEGELVLAGSVPAGPRRAVLVMRLLADGAPDPAFGARRRRRLDAREARRPGARRPRAPRRADRPGRVGRGAAALARATFLAARLTPAGAFDPTFSGDGVARVATTSRRMRGGGAAALALGRSGRLILAGTARGAAGARTRRSCGVAAERVRRPPSTASSTRAGARCGSPRCSRDARGRLVLGGRASGLGAAVLRLRAQRPPRPLVRRRRAWPRAGCRAPGPPRSPLRRDGDVVLAGKARIGRRDQLVVARLQGR